MKRLRLQAEVLMVRFVLHPSLQASSWECTQLVHVRPVSNLEPRAGLQFGWRSRI